MRANHRRHTPRRTDVATSSPLDIVSLIHQESLAKEVSLLEFGFRKGAPLIGVLSHRWGSHVLGQNSVVLSLLVFDWFEICRVCCIMAGTKLGEFRIFEVPCWDNIIGDASRGIYRGVRGERRGGAGKFFSALKIIAYLGCPCEGCFWPGLATILSRQEPRR